GVDLDVELLRRRDVRLHRVQVHVDVAARRALVVVGVAVVVAEDRSLRDAEAALQLLVQEAGEDRRELVEAGRGDANLGAALDRLVGRERAVRKWLRATASAATPDASTPRHCDEEQGTQEAIDTTLGMKHGEKPPVRTRSGGVAEAPPKTLRNIAEGCFALNSVLPASSWNQFGFWGGKATHMRGLVGHTVGVRWMHRIEVACLRHPDVRQASDRGREATGSRPHGESSERRLDSSRRDSYLSGPVSRRARSSVG